jgi:tripartite-type tricarboxylate transporter receptor subunit TctC
MNHTVRSGVIFAWLALADTCVHAQTPPRDASGDAAKYPSRLVRMTVGFTAGGAVDVSGPHHRTAPVGGAGSIGHHR